MDIPKTLEEAIEILKGLNIEPGMINTRFLRNEWGLWAGKELAQWFYTKEIYHADDMSGIIVDSYQKTLAGEPIDLDKQIKHYHKHWEREYGKEHLKIMREHIKDNLVQMRNDRINKMIDDN